MNKTIFKIKWLPVVFSSQFKLKIKKEQQKGKNITVKNNVKF